MTQVTQAQMAALTLGEAAYRLEQAMTCLDKVVAGLADNDPLLRGCKQASLGVWDLWGHVATLAKQADKALD